MIAFFSWAALSRIVRGQTLSLKEKEYVEAARAIGSSSLRIMFVDILPNVMAPVIVIATLLVPSAIVFEATLSFLGVGVVPPVPSWGNMISDSLSYYTTSWWFLIFPSAALVITTLAFNLLGDGVRDALDPQTERIFARRRRRSKPLPVEGPAWWNPRGQKPKASDRRWISSLPDPPDHLRIDRPVAYHRGHVRPVLHSAARCGENPRGEGATPQQVAGIRHRLGLDQPLIVQYWHYLDNLLHGNLGTSFYSGAPVSSMIKTTCHPRYRSSSAVRSCG